MGRHFVVAVAILIHVASGQYIRRPCAPLATAIAPTIQPTVVDGNIVQSLIDTLQLFIVSDLLEETLPEKQKILPVVYDYGIGYEYDTPCDIRPYGDYIFDLEFPEFVTAFVPSTPPPCRRLNLNFGLNEELILPPLSPELPCGLGYLPGGLPVVAKAFAPCSKCGCGCGCCSAAALPVCSPCSCSALATPLSPELSCFVKPLIL